MSLLDSGAGRHTDRHTDKDCPRCRRFLTALRDAREQMRRLEQENGALQEELLAAGEMIEDLASELDAFQK